MLGLSGVLDRYGSKLDIIYEDALELSRQDYAAVVYWNSSTFSTLPSVSPTNSGSAIERFAPLTLMDLILFLISPIFWAVLVAALLVTVSFVLLVREKHLDD